jgi:hypothetical protein
MEAPVHTNPKCPVVCRRLRSKGTPGVSYEDHVTFEAGYVSTATFWCVATAGCVGPDDSFVHPHVCINGRACFSAPQAEAQHS